MRVAYLSPLPPERTGIADYSTELLRGLARRVDLDVFTARPRREHVPAGVRVGRYPRANAAGRLAPYDVVLYQLGNSYEHHHEIYDLALRVPGLVILHEYLLHHLVKEYLLSRGGTASFEQEMIWAYGEAGRRAIQNATHPDPYRYPLFERAVDTARAVVVHSETARHRILLSRPAARISVVPHLALRGPETHPQRDGVLREIGVVPEAFAIGCFGLLTPAKQLGVVAKAFVELRRRVPDARLILVGGVPADYALQVERLRDLDRQGIVLTGRLPLAQLQHLIATIDVAVNLRHPTAGETSGTSVRLLAAGRPLVVHRTGWFAEIPDGCCAKIERGPGEIEHLAAVLEELWRAPRLRKAMGRCARDWFLGHHDVDRAVDGYVAALEETATAPDSPLHPLPDSDPAGFGANVLAGLGRDLADLGLGEDDEEVEELVRTVLDLGLRAQDPAR